MKSDILNSYCLLEDNYLVQQLLMPNTTTILLSSYIAYNEWSCPYMNTSFRVNHTLNSNGHTKRIIYGIYIHKLGSDIDLLQK